MREVAGGEVDSDLELESFSLRLAPDNACSPKAVDCTNLVVCNGNADYGVEPSPFYERGQASLSVETDGENPFWRVTRDTSTSELDGIQWNLPTQCIVENAV